MPAQDMHADAFDRPRSRRDVLRGAALGGGALIATGVLAACGDSDDDSPATAAPASSAAAPDSSAAAPASTGAPASAPAATTVAEATTEAGAAPARGGRMRAALVGGGNTETLDPHKGVAKADIARARNLYDRLTEPAPEGGVAMSLAESFEPNAAADVWTMRLKDGIVFHDGKSLTADDVIFSYQRILDPEQALQGAADIEMIDPRGMRKVDDLTVEFTLLKPDADLPTACSQRALAIIPDGATEFANPVGTGPFKFDSFDVGQRSLFVRNDNFWQEGKPYVDELELISTSDPAARFNALQAGQVDAMEFLDFSAAGALQGRDDVKLLDTRTGHWVPITIPVTQKPFDDVRVRQALRLIVDRQQIIDQALLGFGFLGNDLFCPFDAMYAKDIPQRMPDVEQAKSLLKAAGQEGLTFDLHSSQAAGGMLESALLFAEQAKAAGVTVNVKRGPADSYYDDAYLKGLVAQSDWNNRALGVQIAQCANCKSPYNETEWCRAEFDTLTQEAAGTIDEAKRAELYHEAQQILYDEGGYMIWGFVNFIDAYSPKVNGLVPHVFSPLGYYGFDSVWLS